MQAQPAPNHLLKVFNVLRMAGLQKSCISLAVAAAVVLLAACSATPTRPELTLEKVDLDRFSGRWYILANVPYLAERGKVGSYVEYRKRPDGRFDDLYFFRKGKLDAPLKNWQGIATVLDQTTNARLEASFIWPLKSQFLIAYVDSDYQTALIVTPKRDLAWIYSRQPAIETATLNALKARLAKLGVDRSTLVDIPQLAN